MNLAITLPKCIPIPRAFPNPLYSLCTPWFFVAVGEDLSCNHFFTLAEFCEVLKKFRDWALGPEHLSYHICHLHPSVSAFSLSLYNRIRRENFLLPAWSVVYVVPIPKRPMVLTCYTCKVMGRMVANHLVPTLEKPNTFFLPLVLSSQTPLNLFFD